MTRLLAVLLCALAAARAAPQDCGLPKERGGCNQFAVRYYYDTEYGGCLRFWYGGCDGNGNRFASEAECERACVSPPGDDLCRLPAVRGACKRAKSRWFSDPTGGCRPFTYSGCLGNDNRFETEEECRQRCGGVSPGGGGAPPTAPPPAPGPAACLLADRAAGECGQYVIRYSYVAARRQCAPFYYGGCGGNGNRFDTAEACQAACVKPPSPRPPYYGPGDRTAYSPQQPGYGRDDQRSYGRDDQRSYGRDDQRSYGRDDQRSYGREDQRSSGREDQRSYDREEDRAQPTEAPYEPYRPEAEAPDVPVPRRGPAPAAEDLCSLPKEVGPCRASMPRFYFSAAQGRCLSFVFGGCNGNANNFRTREECEARCGAGVYQPQEKPTEAPETPPPETEEPDSYIPLPTTADAAADLCMLPMDTGPCRAYLPSYYFDADQQRCLPFGYGGCDGNANRFETLSACEQRCAQDADPCMLPKESGPCRAYIPSYYFDASQQRCLPFGYGGCDGNANRFETLSACEQRCAPAAQTEPPSPPAAAAAEEDVCSLLPVGGGCGERLTRHYFNAALRRCFTFVYSGCDGNGNRFDSAAECAARCLPGEPATTEPPALFGGGGGPGAAAPAETTTLDYSDYPTLDYGAEDYGLGVGTDAPVPTNYYDDYYADADNYEYQ